MALGPVELLVVKFPGTEFTDEVTNALSELVASETIRVLDILLIRKDAEADTRIDEIKNLVTGDPRFEPVVAGLTDLLTEEDAEDLGLTLEPDSAAAMILFENTWAFRFTDAMRRAQGEVVINERIPRVVIDELIRAAA
jgi:uncharacterized membrane protein